jgi:iron complex outermembrane receptor protein
LTTKLLFLGGFAVASSFACAGSAFAQRANENVVTSAEDAFGTRIGMDSVGLYDSRNARGFDPQLAGNMRIEGLYFDQQGNFGPRITKSQTMRIGLSAQSYAFPAPTGIADISLLEPADHTVISVGAQYQSIGPRMISGDVSTPLVGDKLSMLVSANKFEQRTEWAGRGSTYSVAGLLHISPSDTLLFIPFLYYNRSTKFEAQPSIFPGTPVLPPRIDRDIFFGQKWASNVNGNFNGGLIMRAAPWTDWRLQAGLFRSVGDRPKNFSILYRNTQSDGTANLDIISYPPLKSASTSGEFRASHVFTDGSFNHTVHMAVRGRDTQRVFGGGDTVNFGAATIGVYRELAEPVFNYGVRDKDSVRQISPGVSYVGQWAGIGEFSVGVQKSFYRRAFGKLGGALLTTRSKPWLYNGTVAVYPTASFAIYGSYTRGLEEFGTAPDNAANAGEPLPAAQTQQVDGGVRYRIKPGLSFMAGVFQVKKPYFGRNTANIYTNVGGLRHRGIEMSLAGQPVQNLTVVAGAVFLQARASGLAVDQGLIGNVSPGTSPRIFKTSFQYDLPWVSGLSVDTQIDINKSYYANRANTLRSPGEATVALGARYAFKAFGANATVRVQMQNVTNEYDWNADGASGKLSPTAPRRYSVRFAADF